ncbi:hypothetical protein H4R21_004862 [Coemansia helicoidea]|uniref:Uncharacterized protein n=1 Tax=Coemansia helicoidea TaxID=1286919 RepID=A0ACC1KWU0_9FUNG|nr:hypothetical protein H4R21_004862 [Coemansia helicoidea]
MSRSIYWFRNIRTKQVLSSTESSVLARPNLVKTQIRANLRPAALRPDHWQPLVVATGFETERALLNTFTLASQPGHPLVPLTAEQKKAYTLLRNSDKRLVDMDMIERQLAQLARTLVYMDAVKSDSIPAAGRLRLLWEDDAWVARIEEAGLVWPQWVDHSTLELKRGNMILNEELRAAAE